SSTWPAWRPRSARRAPRGRPSPRTCCSRWGATATRRAAACVSASGRPPPQPTSTASSSSSRRWWRRRAGKRRPSRMSGRNRTVVAMSGGVDSAVAAARCVAAGHDVIGISLRLAREGTGSCCSLDDFLDARAVADRLGFPHYVFDFTDVFEREVVEPFVAEYLAGRTPNPCARCNEHVKFGLLARRARELGAARLATGHYARIGVDPESGSPRLRTAADATKDQTYFLFALTHRDLERTLFPIGELTKEEVRSEARALGLPVAEKPDSMEVCFVPSGDVAGFVERQAPPEALRPGLVADEAGRAGGRH